MTSTTIHPCTDHAALCDKAQGTETSGDTYPTQDGFPRRRGRFTLSNSREKHLPIYVRVLDCRPFDWPPNQIGSKSWHSISEGISDFTSVVAALVVSETTDGFSKMASAIHRRAQTQFCTWYGRRAATRKTPVRNRPLACFLYQPVNSIHGRPLPKTASEGL